MEFLQSGGQQQEREGRGNSPSLPSTSGALGRGLLNFNMIYPNKCERATFCSGHTNAIFLDFVTNVSSLFVFISSPPHYPCPSLSLLLGKPGSEWSNILFV